jgi:hypothetical protein
LFQIIKRLTIAKEIFDLVSMDKRERWGEERGGAKGKTYLCVFDVLASSFALGMHFN